MIDGIFQEERRLGGVSLDHCRNRCRLPTSRFFGNLTLGRFFTKHIGCYALSNRALAIICLVKVLSPKGERRLLASSPPLERKYLIVYHIKGEKSIIVLFKKTFPKLSTFYPERPFLGKYKKKLT